MIKKVKKWLGIEGVKLVLEIPEAVAASEKVLEGTIVLLSLEPQVVTHLEVRMIERYKRGRGADSLTDEYTLGRISVNRKVRVPAREEVRIPFRLPFELQGSNIDLFGKRNPFFRGMAGLARKAYGVRSTYWIEAVAQVEGVALDPFDRKAITVK